MYEDIGGWFWIVAVAGGPLLLAAGFIYGITRTRRRRRAGETPTGEGRRP